MNAFALILILFLLSILWLPPIATVWSLKHRLSIKLVRSILPLLLLQAILAASLLFLADAMHLHNPAGYTLLAILATSACGVVATFILHRTNKL